MPLKSFMNYPLPSEVSSNSLAWQQGPSCVAISCFTIPQTTIFYSYKLFSVLMFLWSCWIFNLDFFFFLFAILKVIVGGHIDHLQKSKESSGTGCRTFNSKREWYRESYIYSQSGETWGSHEEVGSYSNCPGKSGSKVLIYFQIWKRKSIWPMVISIRREERNQKF